MKLNTDAMPAIDAPFNAQTPAGSDGESRLFIFRGTTYYERRSRPRIEGIPVHKVWKLTASAAVQLCAFDVVAYGVSK